MNRSLRQRAARLAPWALGALLLLIAGWLQQRWLAANGMPDGHQNEYLHVGNAMDLWGAWAAHDWQQVGYFLQGNYWPPGFYMAPWPLFRVMGATHQAMVSANLGHLAVLLAAVYLLARDLLAQSSGPCPRAAGERAGLLAMVGVLLVPAITGNLVRYEPSVALTAWTTLGAWALLRSRSFSNLRYSLLFGVVLSVGLMMDRLMLPFFLGPAALLEWGARGKPWWPRLRGAILALGVAALLTGWWHLDFVQIHLQEVMSQTGSGEIDSAGALTERRAWGQWTTWLWYPLTLLDGQLGVILGGVGVMAVGAGLRRFKELRVPLSVVLGSTLLFTLILKKQAYYSLPMLGCLVVLVAIWVQGRRWPVAVALVLVGAVQLRARMWGADLGIPGAGAEALPLEWVSPRHPMAKAPVELDVPIDSLAQGLSDASEIVVFGEHQGWYEGYVVLQLRERLPQARVRGVIGDPQGTLEVVAGASHVVVVRERSTDAPWPSSSQVLALTTQHHYPPSKVRLMIQALADAQPRYVQAGSWAVGEGRATIWRNGGW